LIDLKEGSIEFINEEGEFYLNTQRVLEEE
jgi:hypothetical protein